MDNIDAISRRLVLDHREIERMIVVLLWRLVVDSSERKFCWCIRSLFCGVVP